MNLMNFIFLRFYPEGDYGKILDESKSRWKRMKSPLVYPGFPADSGYHTVFNQNAIITDRNQWNTIRHLSGQDFSVFFKYIKTTQTFSYMSLHDFVTPVRDT